MKTKRALGAMTASVFLASCGGSPHSATSAVPPPRASIAPGSSGSSVAAVHVKVPGSTTTSSASRAPKFVSGGINGIEIDSSQSGGTPQQHYYDVSPTSALCTPTPGSTARDCTLYVPAPVGDNILFQATTYTTAPSGTSFGTGKALSAASATASIQLASTNTLTLTLRGMPAPDGRTAYIGFGPVQDGSAPYSPIVYVNGYDAAGQRITGSDKYAFDPSTDDAIAITFDDNSTNHLTIAGGQTYTYPTPNLSNFISYDGKGSPGDQTSLPYHATLSAKTTHAGTVLETGYLFTPLFVVLPTVVNGDSTVTFRMAEYGQGNKSAKAQLGSNCLTGGYSAADLTPQTGATFNAETSTNYPEAAIFKLTVGGNRSGSCDITFTDSNNVSLTKTYTGAQAKAVITIPSPAPTPTPTSAA